MFTCMRILLHIMVSHNLVMQIDTKEQLEVSYFLKLKVVLVN